MANTYAANFGDVVKHLVLCEALELERPSRYLESHGGRLDYDLADLDPGPGGVWDFLGVAGDFAALDSSAYARLVRRRAGERARPGRYPGSVAVADAVLPVGAGIVVFELVAESAFSLSEGLRKAGRPAEVRRTDGLVGVCEWARPGDFVLLDPFHVHARSEGMTAAEAWVALASRGVSTVLWYAIYERTESAAWVSDARRSVGEPAWHVRLVGDTADGGLAGCGMLAARLSFDTVLAVGSIVSELARALAVVRPGLRLE